MTKQTEHICPKCSKGFGGKKAKIQHIKAKHHEPSIAELFIEADLNRAMDEPNEEWIEEMRND